MRTIVHGDASARVRALAVPLALVAAVGALLLTAPTNFDFSWSDAPRHALNGAFVLDFVRALPLHDPKTWAIDYYLKYPSLTILFYPPLFYVAEAAVYAVTGVNHFAAQLTVALFSLLLAFSAYALARRMLPQWSALAVALLAVGVPEVAIWGRQVMLDVPADACLALAALCFVRYLDDGVPAQLFAALAAALAAVYTKLNMVYILPVFAVVLIAVRGRALLRDRAVLAAGALAAVGLVPAVLLTKYFGRVNVQSVAGRGGDLSRTSLDAWTYYAKLVPADLGYPVAALALAGLILLALDRRGVAARGVRVLVFAWLAIGYAFFSAIGVREPRHDLTLLFPLILAAVLGLHRALGPRLAQPLALLLAVGTLGTSVAYARPTTVEGYQPVVDYIERNLPPHGVVVFTGYRDGNVVFDIRSKGRSDITTIRGEKLLLGVAIERERGVTERNYSEQQIAAILKRIGAGLVVFESGFWSDLREMSRFAAVMHSRRFQRVRGFDIRGDLADATEAHIEIYRPTYPVVRQPAQVLYDMPVIGGSFHGTVNGGASTGGPNGNP